MAIHQFVDSDLVGPIKEYYPADVCTSFPTKSQSCHDGPDLSRRKTNALAAGFENFVHFVCQILYKNKSGISLLVNLREEGGQDGTLRGSKGFEFI